LSIVTLESIWKRFGDRIVLRGFDMVVEQGEMKIILRGSGSGKSTILKIVLGLVRPDRGRVIVFGNDISDWDDARLTQIRRRIGMVFQAGALFDSLSVGENVAYRLREQNRLPEEEIQSTVRQLLSFVGLEHTVDKMPDELSGGMRRRVAIARALAGDPELMLYDEPTAGLDPITSRTICELLISLRDLRGVTSILVTHDLQVARTLAEEKARLTENGTVEFLAKEEEKTHTNVLLLRDGRVFLEGSLEDLFRSDDPYVREFVE